MPGKLLDDLAGDLFTVRADRYNMREQSEAPVILYKYLAPDRIDVLRTRRIRFTQPDDFNDPFEFRPPISATAFHSRAIAELDGSFDQLLADELAKYGSMISPSAREQLWSRRADLRRSLPAVLGQAVPSLVHGIQSGIYKQLALQVGVLCLSEVRDSVLMWGHYTDSHRGFVVGFDSEHDFFLRRRGSRDEFGFLRKVAYQLKRPSVDLLATTAEEWFQTKSSDWAYEKEWRIVRVLSEANCRIDRQPVPICLFDVPAEAVREIIVGLRAPADLVADLKRLVKDFPAAALLAAREHPQEFRLTIANA